MASSISIPAMVISTATSCLYSLTRFMILSFSSSFGFISSGVSAVLFSSYSVISSSE